MASGTSKPQRTYRLPAEVTSFVGRRQEMTEIRSLLSKSRLVTLTGVGGVGKTRLASRIAVEVGRAFPDGVWLAELAPLEHPELVVQTLADVLELRESPGRTAIDRVTGHLADKKALLILDNCEHLLHDCALVTEEMLAAAPELRVIVTSRQPLRIGGERTLAVHPLPLPDPGDGPLSLDSLAQVDAVRLFVERAEAVLPGFAVTEDNREAVERICRRLDGIPLAIELAAVRLRALSVGQLLERLDDRFRLLAAGSRAAPPRHQTLRALVDWTHDLCTEQERRLWARSSVFSGTLDLEAAEVVCSGDGIAREDVMDLVSGLVEKSVLLREEQACGVRYRLLETLRQYGRDRLADAGEEEALRCRHRSHYADLAAKGCASLLTASQVEWLLRLRCEHANLRTALGSYLGQGEQGDDDAARDGLRMAADLLYHWKVSHHVREGRRWLDQALLAATEPGELRARALWSNAWLAIVQGDLPTAISMLEESHKIAERLALDPVVAYVRLYSGMASMYQGDMGRAIELFEVALAGHRAAGDRIGEVLALTRLSHAYSYEGDSERAVAVAEEALKICDARREDWYKAYALMAFGIEIWRQGDHRRAAHLEKESLRLNSAHKDWIGIGTNLEVLAWVAASEGDHERAAGLLGMVRGIWREVGGPLSGFGHLIRYHDDCEARTREALGEPAYKAAAVRGARLSCDEGLAFAMEERALAAEPSGVPSLRPSPLTRRETEISRLVAEGLSNKDIAARLVISQRTAEGHIEHILSKLGFHSRAQVAVWAAEQRRLREEDR